MSHITREGGGVKGGKVLKKRHVLFEWPLITFDFSIISFELYVESVLLLIEHKLCQISYVSKGLKFNLYMLIKDIL